MKVGDRVVCINDCFVVCQDCQGLNCKHEQHQLNQEFTIDGLDCEVDYYISFAEDQSICCDGTRAFYNPIYYRKIEFNYGKELAEQIAEEINKEQLVPV